MTVGAGCIALAWTIFANGHGIDGLVIDGLPWFTY